MYSAYIHHWRKQKENKPQCMSVYVVTFRFIPNSGQTASTSFHPICIFAINAHWEFATCSIVGNRIIYIPQFVTFSGISVLNADSITGLGCGYWLWVLGLPDAVCVMGVGNGVGIIGASNGMRVMTYHANQETTGYSNVKTDLGIFQAVFDCLN